MRFLSTISITLLFLPVFSLISHADDVERYSVVGKRPPTQRMPIFLGYNVPEKFLIRRQDSYRQRREDETFYETICKREKQFVEIETSKCLANIGIISPAFSTFCVGAGGGIGYVVKKLAGAVIAGATSGGFCSGIGNQVEHYGKQQCYIEKNRRLNSFCRLFNCKY